MDKHQGLVFRLWIADRCNWPCLLALDQFGDLDVWQQVRTHLIL